MSIIHKSIIIHAAPDKVWNQCADINTWPTWYVGLEKVSDLHGSGSVGTTCDLTFAMGGGKTQLKYTILEADRPRQFVGSTSGVFHSTSTWTYKPEGEGTKLSLTMEYTLPGSILGKIADKFFLEKRISEDLEKTLQNIKELAEK